MVSYLDALVLAFVLIYFLVSRILKNSGKPDPTEILVCNKCDSSKYNDGQLRCDCGGVFLKIKELRNYRRDKNANYFDSDPNDELYNIKKIRSDADFGRSIEFFLLKTLQIQQLPIEFKQHKSWTSLEKSFSLVMEASYDCQGCQKLLRRIEDIAINQNNDLQGYLKINENLIEHLCEGHGFYSKEKISSNVIAITFFSFLVLWVALREIWLSALISFIAGMTYKYITRYFSQKSSRYLENA